MIKKKSIRLYWALGIIILALVILSQTDLFKKQEESMSLKVHYYDENGKEILPNKGIFSLFSIIIPSEVVEAPQIAFSIVVTNTGNTRINNTIVSTFPSELKNYFNFTFFQLKEGESKLLMTNPMNTSLLEDYEQPINFSVNISGVMSYPQQGATPLRTYSTGYLSLAILSPYMSYQEATNSYTTNDGAEAVYTGAYSVSGTNSGNAVDKNWDTYSYGGTTGSFYYFNYTKAIGATGALWKVKDGTQTVIVSIPSSCWNYDSNKIMLKALSVYCGGGTACSPSWVCGDSTPCYNVVWFCYTGEGEYINHQAVENPAWVMLRNPANFHSTAPSSTLARIYEEGIYWKIPQS